MPDNNPFVHKYFAMHVTGLNLNTPNTYAPPRTMPVIEGVEMWRFNMSEREVAIDLAHLSLTTAMVTIIPMERVAAYIETMGDD